MSQASSPTELRDLTSEEAQADYQHELDSEQHQHLVTDVTSNDVAKFKRPFKDYKVTVSTLTSVLTLVMTHFLVWCGGILFS